jgi:hypothetical protein
MKHAFLAAALLLATASAFVAGVESAAAGGRDSGGHGIEPTWRTGK